MTSIVQSSPPDAAGRIKHYYLDPPGTPDLHIDYVPRFYFEARIDFADVRSGLRETRSVSHAVEILPAESDLIWTEDMVWTVDPASLRSSPPGQAVLAALPGGADADAVSRAEINFLRFLLRYYKIRIYRNFALNIYSSQGESLQDFIARCRDTLSGGFRRDVDDLHEVFQRKIEQLKGKYLKLKDLGEFEQSIPTVQYKSMLHEISEQVAQMFLGAELSMNPVSAAPPREHTVRHDLEERLLSLEQEARQSIGRLVSTYQEEVRNIDEYIIHPSLKDIHLVRSCILWMPAGVPPR